jgi:sulfonate transport system substrate-binding protein
MRIHLKSAVPLILCATASAEIRIAVNSTTIESAPVFLAERTPGVKIVPVPNGRAAMAQLLDGSVDAATGSETQALLNSTTQPEMRIIVTLAEATYRIVARKSAGIRRVDDLRGKKVAATLNTSSQYFLREMLRTAGLRESDVQFVNLEGPAMPAALKRGDVDAVAIWEPHAQNSIEALGSDAVDLRNPAVYRERFNLNTTARVLRDPSKRKELVGFLKEVLRASDRIRGQRRQSIVFLAPSINTSEQTIGRVWNQFRFPANLPDDLPGAMAGVEKYVAAVQNRPPRTPEILRSLIDTGPLIEARLR